MPRYLENVCQPCSLSLKANITAFEEYTLMCGSVTQCEPATKKRQLPLLCISLTVYRILALFQ